MAAVVNIAVEYAECIVALIGGWMQFTKACMDDQSLGGRCTEREYSKCGPIVERFRNSALVPQHI